jgi:hypothetical protein
MTIVRKAAQIVGGNVDQAHRSGTAKNSVLEVASEEIREDRDDVEAHEKEANF